MNRRTFLKAATGLLVPAALGLQVDPEPIKRYWALDRTMTDPMRGYVPIKYTNFNHFIPSGAEFQINEDPSRIPGGIVWWDGGNIELPMEDMRFKAVFTDGSSVVLRAGEPSVAHDYSVLSQVIHLAPKKWGGFDWL